MALTGQQIREYLALYGTELEQWPQPLREEVMQGQYQSLLNNCIIEQQYADEVLLSHRHYEPMSPDLANRIIRAAGTTRRTSRFALAVWIQEMLAPVFPRPSVAIAAMLTLGVAIGFTMPAVTNNKDSNFILAFMDEE